MPCRRRAFTSSGHRFPYVPGMDVAGMILELGDGVNGLAVGDEVFAQMSMGGLAEVAAAPASSVWTAPTGVPLSACANLGRNFFQPTTP